MAEPQHLRYDEASHRLHELIKNKETFLLRGLDGQMSKVIKEIERIIKEQQMTCRVYTRNRGYAIAATLAIPIVDVVAVGFIAAHRLATYDPDYEIGKDLKDKRLHVTYKR
jgi:hypothetical protein